MAESYRQLQHRICDYQLKIHRLERENAELRKRTEWLPIDEAPPVDVPVWLYSDEHGVFIGALTDNDHGLPYGNCYGTEYFRDGAWKASDCYIDDDYQPTHWMPLPCPPRKST